MNRRDFLFGAVAGVCGAGVVGAAGTRLYHRPSPSPPCPPPDARLSFSQQGEDLVIYSLLHEYMKLDRPTYLDIGAADPVESNNTYLLYCTGSRGVLVEPNPVYVEKLKAYRPGDDVVGVGIGVSEVSEADYFVIRGQPTLNTFSRKEADRLRQKDANAVEKVMKMPLVTINRLIAEHLGRAPDFLSIDVEGMDLEILRTLDFAAYRPGAICVETIRLGSLEVNTAVGDFLATKGYVARGGSFINTIFVDPARLV